MQLSYYLWIINQNNELKKLLPELQSLIEKQAIETEVVQWINKKINLIKNYIPNKVDFLSWQDSVYKHKNKITNIFEGKFPSSLKLLPDPPLVLFYQGNLDLIKNEERMLAVVGSRKHSVYAEQAIKQIFSNLKQAQLVIVSGLAFGVDALAHEQALQNNLPTVAILGSGISNECIYPKNNFFLASKILENNGLLISEYTPWESARKHYFLARNRIIAGLCKATLVIESAQKSGALVTAGLALDYNKEVLAIPGNINSPCSMGPNWLISQGAKMVTQWQDLSEIFNFQIIKPTAQMHTQLTPKQRLVLECIQKGVCELEKIIINTNIPLTETLAVLSFLELSNLIAHDGYIGYKIL